MVRGEAKLEHRFASEHQIPVGLIEPNPHFHAAAVMQFQQTNQAKFLREAHPYPFENVSLNYRYPLILAIHSWYSFGTDQKILEKAFDRLVPGGHLWIALVAPNNMIYEIGEATQNFTAKSLHSQGLSEWAVQAGFPHEYITTQKKIPHAQLFDASGNWTPAGERFAAFSTFKAWSEIEQSDREMIRTIIEAHATHDGEYFLLHHGSLVFKKDS